MAMYEWNEDACRQYADSMHPMTRFDHRRWAERIASAIEDLPDGATLVDVATGPGFLLVAIGRLVPGLDLVALDQAEPMLAVAREEATAAGLSITTVCSAAESLSLGDEEADVVTCKQLLHEADDPKKVMAEALRVLKPGGRLYLIDFDADGSRVAAAAVRALITVMGGLAIARTFWRSYRAGLHGADVRTTLLEVGFASAEYERSGFNYFITGVKGV
jgi:ubiquinone/menaquinone biosynthesis C-methylase UbiE